MKQKMEPKINMVCPSSGHCFVNLEGSTGTIDVVSPQNVFLQGKRQKETMWKADHNRFIRKLIRRFPKYKCRQKDVAGYHTYLNRAQSIAAQTEDLTESVLASDDHDVGMFANSLPFPSKTYSENYVTICPGCPLSENAAKSSILAFMLRFNLPFCAVESLIGLINAFLPTPALKSSQFLFYKCFNTTTITKHHFCHQCKNYIGENIKFPYTCPDVKCGKIMHSSEMYLAKIPLANQIEHFFSENPDILTECVLNNYKVSHSYEDIYDGSMYKKIQEFSGGNNFLTINFCTDGVQVLKSAKYSMWPLQFVINELPPSFRFRNILMAGIWYGNENVPMESILQLLTDELVKLSQEGIAIGPFENKIKIYCLAGVADSKAKCDIQGLKQYNGYFGCTTCYIAGYSSTISKSKKMVYPHTKHHTLLRSEGSYKQDVISLSEGLDSRGLLYVTPLVKLREFSVIENFTIDYMHSVLIGVVKHLVDIWMSPKNVKKPFSLVHLQQQMDNRLLSLRPPTLISRRPQSITRRKSWKANQWRSWLLYYAFAVLPGIFPQRFTKNFLLLSTATWTLLGTSVSFLDVTKAEAQLKVFVEDYQTLYGIHEMTYNVHQLLHLSDVVRKFGPLWTTSMFPFETFNKVIKDCVKGYRHPQIQVMRKFYLLKDLQLCPEETIEAPIVRNLLEKYPLLRRITCKRGDAVGIGKIRECSFDIICFDQMLKPTHEFDTVLYKGCKFCTSSHDKDLRYINSICATDENEFVELEKICFVPNVGFYIRVYIICCKPFVFENTTIKHVNVVDSRAEISTWIPIERIISPCIKMTVSHMGGLELICVMPNIVEMD